MDSFKTCARPEDAVDELERLFDAAVLRLQDAIGAFVDHGTVPDADTRAKRLFNYPELRVVYTPNGRAPKYERAFARFNAAGTFSVSIARPALFRHYILEQLDALIEDYGATVQVGPSEEGIPYPFVLESRSGGPLPEGVAADLARHFPNTKLAHIGDEVADGTWNYISGKNRPLALFDARRTDFSLHRLKHYTGTPAEHVQRFILFTNYQRYVEEFIGWAAGQIKEGSIYSGLSCPGGLIVKDGSPASLSAIAALEPGKFQMPAYHLMSESGGGITMVNIGVGPSNAKTITDHLAVLRPEAWLMIGHCGGLRPSQIIGDYVLAHAYLRDDHVLDDILPPEIPIPAIAEVQRALEEATRQVTGETGETLKRRVRTGTVVTTDDRNWELRYARSALRFNQSRAVAVDMESATIAAQGYRFRVPYGALLCVSDKPVHGEIKLPGSANTFYARAVSEHIRIGIATVDLLKKAGNTLHSRKLRSFNEPPFR